MKIKFDLDTKDFDKRLRGIRITERELRDIEYPASRVVVNKQKENVPVDKGTTKMSIDSHIIESSAVKIVDDIGPETNYAIYLEMGTGEFAESGKGRKGGWFYKDDKGNWHFTLGMRPRPYVRPSIFGNESNIIAAFTKAFEMFLEMRWKI